MTMEIGVALWTMQSTAAAPANHATLYRELPAHALLAEELGFASLWLAEHRFWYDGFCPAPLIAAASAAAVTTRLRFGTAMLLLPQHDPTRIAATAAALDRLSGGRLDLGVGLGHRDAEFDGLGVARTTRGARMDTALDVLLSAWDGELLPVQRPHPPIWVGGMAEAAIRRGARRGLSFLLPQTLYPEEVTRLREQVRGAAAEAGVEPGRIGVLRDVWVADDGPAARREVLPRLAAHYREEAGSWWILKGRHHGFADPAQLDRQLTRITDTALVGTPEEVTGGLVALRDAGADLATLRLHFDVTRSGLPDALRRCARDVLPAFAPVAAP